MTIKKTLSHKTVLKMRANSIAAEMRTARAQVVDGKISAICHLIVSGLKGRPSGGGSMEHFTDKVKKIWSRY